MGQARRALGSPSLPRRGSDGPASFAGFGGAVARLKVEPVPAMLRRFHRAHDEHSRGILLWPVSRFLPLGKSRYAHATKIHRIGLLFMRQWRNPGEGTVELSWGAQFVCGQAGNDINLLGVLPLGRTMCWKCDGWSAHHDPPELYARIWGRT
jgi:hypothetical protein